MRAIVGARVSTFSDKKVSHEAQHETGQKWVLQNHHQIVGTFEDLGISAGKFTPFQRPDLGQWLDPHKRLHEWDVIVFSKIDRAFRSIRDAVEFAKFCQANNKMLVFAEDGQKLDYTLGAKSTFETQMNELFITLGAFFGQIELERFKSRALDKERVLRQTDRWSKGNPPFGFRIVDHPSGKGKTLAHDPVAQQQLHEAADLIIDQNWATIRVAEKFGWSNGSSRRWLTQLSTQGIKVHQGQPVLDPEGSPVRVGPPTFTDERWDRLQAVLLSRKTGHTRTKTDNPIYGVGVCGVCGAGLTRSYGGPNKTFGYFRCSKQRYCKGVIMRETELLKYLEERFLELRGDKPVEIHRFVPGEDRSYELKQTQDSIARLQLESDAGLITDTDLYISRLTALTARLRDLQSNPIQSPSWVTEKLLETNSERWFSRDWTGRREMLRQAEIKLKLTSKFERELIVP
jgi:site-specific DNA recombinase